MGFNSKNLDKLLKFRKELFGVRKELFLLSQKKNTHDSKIESFLSNLKVPKGRGVSTKKVALTLNKKEVEFKDLFETEQFLLLCKQRLLELIQELETLNDKSLSLSLKKYLDKNDESANLKEELTELKEKVEELKDNQNILSHSFSAFQDEARKRLLVVKERT